MPRLEYDRLLNQVVEVETQPKVCCTGCGRTYDSVASCCGEDFEIEYEEAEGPAEGLAEYLKAQGVTLSDVARSYLDIPASADIQIRVVSTHNPGEAYFVSTHGRWRDKKCELTFLNVPYMESK